MRWGSWELKMRGLALVHVSEYEIDLESVRSSGVVLDWIFQVQAQDWADAQTMHDLLRAFDDVLSPQVNFCGDTTDRSVTGGRLAWEYALEAA
jgi:hypothetical protein